MRGSVLVTYDETFQTFGIPFYEILINDVDARDYQFGEGDNLYSTYIFSGNTISARILRMGYGEIGSINLFLKEYTNDNEGDNGIKTTFITGVTGSNTDTFISCNEIPINPSPNAYNFEVIVNMGITQGCAPIASFSGTSLTFAESVEIITKNVGVTQFNTNDIYIGLNSSATTKTYDSNPIGSVVRLNADYSLDFGFNSLGPLGNYFSIADIELQNDGRVIVGGQETFGAGSVTGYSLNRLTTTGALDPTFTRYLFGGFGSQAVFVSDVSQQSDGKIIASGNFITIDGSTYNRYARFNYDGTIDNTFYSGGTGTGFSIAVNNEIDSKDRVYMFTGIGAFSTFNGSQFGGILRLTKDGQLDTTFNGTGLGGFSKDVGAAIVNSVTILSDNKILCAGSFNRYNGVPCPQGLVRLNEDGTLDTTFNNGGSGLFTPSLFTVSPCEAMIEKKEVYLIVYDTNLTSNTYNGITIPNDIFMINKDGSLNMEFNTNAGTGIIGGEPGSGPRSVKRLSNDSFLIVGNITQYNGTSITNGGVIQISSTGILQNC